MSRLLEEWLNNQVQMTKPIQDLGMDFANGYLLGELLHRYNQIDRFDEMADSRRVSDKVRNYCVLERNLKRLGVALDATTALKMMDGDHNSWISMVSEVKLALGLLKSTRVGKHKDIESLNGGTCEALINMPHKLPKQHYDASNSAIFARNLEMKIKSQNQVYMDAHLSKFYQEKARQLKQMEEQKVEDSDKRDLYFADIRQRKLFNAQARQEKRAESNQQDLEVWAEHHRRRQYVINVNNQVALQLENRAEETRIRSIENTKVLMNDEFDAMEQRAMAIDSVSHPLEESIPSISNPQSHTAFLKNVEEFGNREPAENRILEEMCRIPVVCENIAIKYAEVVKQNRNFRNGQHQLQREVHHKKATLENRNVEWYSIQQARLEKSRQVAAEQRVLNEMRNIVYSIVDRSWKHIEHRIDTYGVEVPECLSDVATYVEARFASDTVIGDKLCELDKHETTVTLPEDRPIVFSCHNFPGDWIERLRMRFHLDVIRSVNAVEIKEYIAEHRYRRLLEYPKFANTKECFDSWSNGNNVIDRDSFVEIVKSYNVEGDSIEHVEAAADNLLSQMNLLDRDVTFEQFDAFMQRMEIDVAQLTLPDQLINGFLLVDFPRTEDEARQLELALGGEDLDALVHQPEPCVLFPRQHTPRKFPMDKSSAVVDGFFLQDLECPVEIRDRTYPKRRVLFDEELGKLQRWYQNQFHKDYEFERVAEVILEKIPKNVEEETIEKTIETMIETLEEQDHAQATKEEGAYGQDEETQVESVPEPVEDAVESAEEAAPTINLQGIYDAHKMIQEKVDQEIALQRQLRDEFIDYFALERSTFIRNLVNARPYEANVLINFATELKDTVDIDMKFDPVTKQELLGRIGLLETELFNSIRSFADDQLAIIDQLKADPWLDNLVAAYQQSIDNLTEVEVVRLELAQKIMPEYIAPTMEALHPIDFQSLVEVHRASYAEYVAHRKETFEVELVKAVQKIVSSIVHVDWA